MTNESDENNHMINSKNQKILANEKIVENHDENTHHETNESDIKSIFFMSFKL